MSLDKAIAHGKVFRRPYRGSAAFDPSCRNHGSCPWCIRRRRYQRTRVEDAAREAIKDWKNTKGRAL